MKIRDLSISGYTLSSFVADECDRLINLIFQMAEVGAIDDYVADFLNELIFQKFGDLLTHKKR